MKKSIKPEQNEPQVEESTDNKSTYKQSVESTLPNKHLFRVDETAAYFNVDRQTIYKWIEHGLLIGEKYDKKRSGCINITRESIVELRLNSRMFPKSDTPIKEDENSVPQNN